MLKKFTQFLIKMEYNPEIRNWICNCPASDQNFKSQLEMADIPTCEEALKNNCISKVARQAITSKLRKLNKESKK